MDIKTKVLDMNALFFGTPTEELMENAGKALAKEAKKTAPKKWLILCGSGNNGGDGYAAARYIKNCEIVMIKQPRTPLSLKNFRRAKAQGIKITRYDKNTFDEILKKYDGIIDAMLGVGIVGEIKEPYKHIIKIINKAEKFIISADIPTGFGTKTEVTANLIVTFNHIKEGLKTTTGEIVIADIGIPKEATEQVGLGDLLYYPKPDTQSHKGGNGIVAVIGGGPYTGAPALSALASLRIGCDLSFVCCPFHSYQIIASYSPDIITRRMEGAIFTEDNISEIKDILEKADAILIGPGLGKDEKTIDACRSVVEKYSEEKPIVVDADAIESISDISTKGTIIVTPHSNELKKLITQLLPLDIEKRKQLIKTEAKKRGLTILHKGPVDIISDGTDVKINMIHNEAMTVGGTGDVLAGLCVGLVAKKVKPFNAACIAAFINGMAGNAAFQEKSYGLLASDIIEKIPEILKTYID